MIDLEAIRKWQYRYRHLAESSEPAQLRIMLSGALADIDALIAEVERLHESACPCCQESDSIRAYLERKAVNLAAKQTDETDKP